MLLAIASSGEEWEDVTEEWDAAVRRECRKLRRVWDVFWWSRITGGIFKFI